jgi:hypothetical protein
MLYSVLSSIPFGMAVLMAVMSLGQSDPQPVRVKARKRGVRPPSTQRNASQTIAQSTYKNYS